MLESRETVRELAMFPLLTVLHPYAVLPLQVFEQRYRQLTMRCVEEGGDLGVVLIERGSDVGGWDVRCAVGASGAIEDVASFADGRFALVVRGKQRVRVRRWLSEEPYPRALVEEIETIPLDPGAPCDRSAYDRAYVSVRRARALLSELGDIAPLPAGFELGDNLDVAAWRLCALAPLRPADSQRLLEVDDAINRLELLGLLTDAVADKAMQLLAKGVR